MLRSNPAIAMRRQKRTRLPAAASPRTQALRGQHAECGQSATWCRPLDRTSRPEPPAIGQMPSQRRCSETPQRQPSRSPHGCGRCAPPMGARDREPYTPRSRGRSGAVFYNRSRPHSALGYITPAAYAANLTATDDRLRNPDQLRRSPVAQPAPYGVKPAEALIAAG
jgi:hypothetical protein